MVETVSKAGLVGVVEPKSYPIEKISAVHDQDYINFIRDVNITPIVDAEFTVRNAAPIAYPFTFPYTTGISAKKSTSIVAQMGRYCFDLATPITKETYEAAYKSVEIALTGADLVAENKDVAVSVCRPPGHHALRAMSGGYCYFNNAAVAAVHLQNLQGGHEEKASPAKVAILDVDFHHGNGTQEIFYEDNTVLYVSIHHTPDGAYPYFTGFEDERGSGRGEGYNVNYPLPSGTTESEYSEILAQALDVIKKFEPQYLIISLGFDTFSEDPISSFKLGETYYTKMAEQISSLSLPTLLLTEGGYSVEKLGTLLANFILGWKRRV